MHSAVERHASPYLAVREQERLEFERLLGQTTILENLVLTGLRGVGKTVLLDTFKPLAISHGWHWAGADLSESVSVSEDALATRLLADLSVVSSSVEVGPGRVVGFEQQSEPMTLDYPTLVKVYAATPGLAADKLKAVLELVAEATANEARRGIVFAYDEAQNLADSPAGNEFPLSLLLDVFQSIQRKGIPFMLVLTGLPTLFPKLVEARTFAERMFRVVALDKLDDASREAIDSDFFAGRWARATDRQRQLLWCTAQLERSDGEFTVQEIVEESKRILPKPFSNSHTNQMLSTLSEMGLIYKNRWGRYSFAVPLFDRFIQRQSEAIEPRLGA